jgi:metallo-beta-lactamase family protein
MKLSFYGAAHQVTGSNYLITCEDHQYLVDCGLFQGTRIAEAQNFDDFRYHPGDIEAVFVTHAHLDHIGRLPKLWSSGFRGQVYATGATRDLTRLVLEDAVGLIEEEALRDGHEPLYTIGNVEAIMEHFEVLDYELATKVNNITAIFHDAGHILGSSTITIYGEGKEIVFSGDFGNPPMPILKPPYQVKKADVLVLESTYGGIVHEPPGSREKELRDAIFETIKNGGVLMIPAFAIERTQEILYELDHLVRHHHIPPVPIFLDAPLAAKATDVFKRYPEHWNQKAVVLKESGEDFFNFDGLQVTLTTEQSKEINRVPPPKVIIAGAGMMHGGRILHHAKRYLQDPKSTLLVVGYQAQGTMGRKLFDGARRVTIHGESVRVRARIKTIGAYSAHADEPGLIKWLAGFDQKPSQIFLTHGEIDKAEALKSAIAKKYPEIKVEIPSQGSEWEI